MIAVLALFVDAYRLLNARKIFWLTMILSLLVVGSFALVGINEQGISIAWWDLEIFEINTGSAGYTKALFYKVIFTEFGVNIWLAWVATILGLITTASIFPEFLGAGSIDIVLSKPISRFKLFVVKYLTGLLFVFLQVSVFTTASFLVIGFRGGAWEPGLFIAIPLVTLFFSYLFSICALLGVITRSTIASLLLTVLVWFLLFIVQSADASLMFFNLMLEQRVEGYTAAVERTETQLAKVEDPDDTERWAFLHESLEKRKENLANATSSATSLDAWHSGLLGVLTVLPKTGETIDLLSRWTIDLAELPEPMDSSSRTLVDDDGDFRPDHDRLGQDMNEARRARSPWWILGTSTIFELVLVAFGAWLFRRRDF
jgi:ABC-type transport system involved in multi-copper enzyme maturation permease subunit